MQLQDMFQQNGNVYYRLAPLGAMDAPAPVALPPHIGEKYLIRPDSLQGWIIQTYMKQKEVLPGRWVQERKLDFIINLDSIKELRITNTFPHKMKNKTVYLSSSYNRKFMTFFGILQ
ncbi:hypothetical protein ACT7DJ_17505 [Bacillus cereus]